VRRILRPSSLAPGSGYSHGVTVTGGHTTWTAGQVAFDSDGNVVGEGDIVAQTRKTFENLAAVLRETGATFADVVKLNYFVTDISQVAEIRAVRDEFVDTEHPPASTLVEVAGLVRPELLIEIEAVVVVED
jgi:enamine deaminase RidA (YjgF/YER057c/UK114 family)